MASKNINKENIPNFILKIDTTSEAGVIYIGTALPGSSNNDNVWQIQKFDGTSLLFAKGNDLFDKSWADRTSYSYA